MADQSRNGAHSRKLGFQSFLLILTISALSTLVTLAFALFLMEWRTDLSVFDRGNCIEAYQGLFCFIEQPLDDSGLVSVLSTFYTNIIVILIAILALVTTIATIGIRFSSRQQIESELPDLTEAFFMSAVGSKKVETILSTQMQESNDRLQSQEELLNAMLEKIERIEYRLEELDTGENVVLPEDQEED